MNVAFIPSGTWYIDIPAVTVGLLLTYPLLRRQVRRGKMEPFSRRFYLIISAMFLGLTAFLDALPTRR